MSNPQATIATYRRDPCAFVEQVLCDPETAKPFVLYAGQREFIRRAFTLDANGRLPYSDLVFSAPKKSGKTATAAFLALYTAIVIGGKFAEIYCLANDYEQASSRVFQAVVRIIEASPLLKGSATILKDRITFNATGATISAHASDYSGFAGANPTLTIFDELWGYTSESSHRLWDEAVPPPTRKVAARLVTTYAGFSGESVLLEGHYKRGVLEAKEIAPSLFESPGMLCRWATDYVSIPWVDAKWLEESRRSLRPNQFRRLIQNQWVTSESGFLPMEDFDASVNSALTPRSDDENLPVWVGIDASVKRDATAVAVVTFNYSTNKVELVDHRIFTPKKDEPVNFAALESYLLSLRRRFAVRLCPYDPYQFASTEQRMTVLGLPMEAFPQTLPNLEQASSNLYDLFRYRRITLYPDAQIRMAMSHTVAVETPRGGTRISKSRASHHIDVIAALSFACLFAVREGSYKWEVGWQPVSAAPRQPNYDSDGGRFLPDGTPDYAYTTGESMAKWEDDQADRAMLSRRRWNYHGHNLRGW